MKLPEWNHEGYLNAQAQGLEDIHIRAYACALLEAAAEVVHRREVENGTEAEGEEEPWFSIHIHTEAHLHNAVGDIRALKEDL